MEDLRSNTFNLEIQIEDYIEFINLQLKNPNTQDIPVTNGSFYEFWKEYPIYNFKITTNLQKIRDHKWRLLDRNNGQRKNAT